MKNLIKKIIKEEIEHNNWKILQESKRDYEKIKKILKYDPKKIKNYKIGRGNRFGVKVNPNDLKKFIGKSPTETISIIEKMGIVFDEAYVDFRELTNYRTKKVTPTMTYSFFGRDSNGEPFIYDKYEGHSPGGGQAWVFYNKKKRQASEFIENSSPEIMDQINKVFDSAGLKKTNTKIRKNLAGEFHILPDLYYNIDSDNKNVQDKVWKKLKKILPKINKILKTNKLTKDIKNVAIYFSQTYSWKPGKHSYFINFLTQSELKKYQKDKDIEIIDIIKF